MGREEEREMERTMKETVVVSKEVEVEKETKRFVPRIGSTMSRSRGCSIPGIIRCIIVIVLCISLNIEHSSQPFRFL